MSKLKLHGYFRSGAAYRVRIALNLKGLSYDQASVHLRRGEQFSAAFSKLNPAHLVPALEDGPEVLRQSLAIIEYLEETHPEPPLLPSDPAGRARVRALAYDIACDIHPIDNLRVMVYMEKILGLDQKARDAWYAHWIRLGFEAIEATLARGAGTGRFCHGDAPTLADVCLIPQLGNAARVNLDLTPYPTIRRIAGECRKLEAFQRAEPQNQPDAEA